MDFSWKRPKENTKDAIPKRHNTPLGHICRHVACSRPSEIFKKDLMAIAKAVISIHRQTISFNKANEKHFLPYPVLSATQAGLEGAVHPVSEAVTV